MLAWSHRDSPDAGLRLRARPRMTSLTPAPGGIRLAVENAGAESAFRASLTLWRDLRRKAAAGCALGTFVIECPVPATLRRAGARGLRLRRHRHGAFDDRFLATRGADRRGTGSRSCHTGPSVGRGHRADRQDARYRRERNHGTARRVTGAGARDRRAGALRSTRQSRFLASDQVRFAERAVAGARRRDLRRGADRRTAGARRTSLRSRQSPASMPYSSVPTTWRFHWTCLPAVQPVFAAAEQLARPSRTASRSGSTSTTPRSAATGPHGVSRCNASASTGACWRTARVRSWRRRSRRSAARTTR